MDISVQPLASLSQPFSWQVQMGRHQVTFRTEDEARGFVQALEKRISAEHLLPALPDVPAASHRLSR